MCLLSIGCTRDDGIQQYAVPKEQPPQVALSSAAGEENVWFFKISGPKDQVPKYLNPFTDIIRTAEFSSGTPRYEMPDGWHAAPGPPPRYETITIPETDPPLEVTVSSLPSPGADFDSYLQANINRWRGQLGLEPVRGQDWRKKAEEQSELITVPAEDRTITMVRLLGSTETFGETLMLAAVISEGAESAMAQPGPASSQPPGITYEIPAGWEESPGNAVRVASLRVSHAAGAADVSVTRFLGGGDLLANVNRWRGQIGLPPIDESQLAKGVEDLTVHGKPGTLVELQGEQQAILGVTVEDGDSKWFFKMQGPVDSVLAEKQHFRAFLDSVKFETK
jgi:hypothetical protein